MSSKHLCNFIAILNLAVRTKKRSISISIKTNYIKSFIDLLLKEGLIFGYNLEKKKKISFNREEETATLHFKKNLIKEVKLISSPSYKKSVTIYKLRSLHYKSRGTCFIMSSSHLGFSTSHDCERKNIGGLLICGIVLN